MDGHRARNGRPGLLRHHAARAAPEDLRRQALALYDAGARRFALWDCIVRVNVRAMWDVARRLGHEDWLRRDGAAAYRTFRVHELGGDDVSRYLPMWGG